MKKGWEICPLDKYIKFIDYRGHTPTKTQSGMRLITAKNVKEGFLQREPEEFVDPKIYDKWMVRGFPKKGDVLFTTEAPLANVAQLDTDEKVLFAQRIIIFQPQEDKIDQTFLKYLLLSDPVRKQIFSKGTGATVQGIKARLLKTVEIPVPPLPEQQRIVSVLDEAFASIEQAKSNAEKNLVNARELFNSVLNEIFIIGGADWEEKRIDEICENLDSQRVPVTKRHRKEGKYPYYGASGIVDYVDEFIFDEELLLISEDGANLLARTYPIAFSISGKTWVNNHAHVLRFEKMTTQKFVEYYLNSIPLDDYVSGMAQPKLNQAMMNSIVIPFPPLAEQRAIVGRLEALSAETGRLEEIYQQKLESLEELRRSVLAKAFAGEL